jgi:multiple sugar transport system substrate-binding protein
MEKKILHLLVCLLIITFIPLALTPAANAEVTISYSDWQLAQDIWGRSLREAIAEFERLNPDIKVKPEPVALGQRDVKYTTAIRGGKGPDVFALDANPVKQYIKGGWVKDLTSFIEKEGGRNWLADFYPVSLMPVTENGGTYGIPKNVVATGRNFERLPRSLPWTRTATARSISGELRWSWQRPALICVFQWC